MVFPSLMPTRMYIFVEEDLNDNVNVKAHLVNVSQPLPLFNGPVYRVVMMTRIKGNAGLSSMNFRSPTPICYHHCQVLTTAEVNTKLHMWHQSMDILERIAIRPLW